MHRRRPTKAAPYRVGRAAVLAVAMLCVTFLILDKAPSAIPSGRSSTQQAPRVKPAVDAVVDLFKQKQVVALGDFHGLAQEEAFYSTLVRDPRFADQVGNVVVEFGGSAAQGIIDRYVNSQDVPFTELRHVWTDMVGSRPGPFTLGYINFFANVRAANLKLPPEHRIKIWLGDPKIDWSKINSFQDLQPYLSRRDDNIFQIISDEILKKQKKALLIIGSGHLFAPDFGPGRPRALGAMITEAYPNSMAVVMPFTGYIEPECSAKLVARAKDWPVPAVAGPVEGTWLKSELQLPGCNYIPAEQVKQMKDQVERMNKMASAVPPSSGQGPGKPPSLADMISAQSSMQSGLNSDAILYLGSPDTLTQSPFDPSIYLDPDYFTEMSRRAKCCFPGDSSLDWDQMLQQNSVVPRKFPPH
jgi:hypothetical protein